MVIVVKRTKKVERTRDSDEMVPKLTIHRKEHNCMGYGLIGWEKMAGVKGWMSKEIEEQA